MRFRPISWRFRPAGQRNRQRLLRHQGSVAPDDDVLGQGVGIGLRKGDTELKDKLNAAIKAIRSSHLPIQREIASISTSTPE